MYFSEQYHTKLHDILLLTANFLAKKIVFFYKYIRPSPFTTTHIFSRIHEGKLEGAWLQLSIICRYKVRLLFRFCHYKLNKTITHHLSYLCNSPII